MMGSSCASGRSSAAGNQLMCTRWGNNPGGGRRYLCVHTSCLSGGRNPLLVLGDGVRSESMGARCGVAGVEWTKGDGRGCYWNVHAPMFGGSAFLSASLLWVRMLTRSTQVDRSVTLECGAALIHSYVPLVQVPGLGVTALLTFPAPLSSPALGVNFSVEMLACGLTLKLRLIQVFVTSCGYVYRALVALCRTSVVLFPGRGVRFHLVGE